MYRKSIRFNLMTYFLSKRPGYYSISMHDIVGQLLLLATLQLARVSTLSILRPSKVSRAAESIEYEPGVEYLTFEPAYQASYHRIGEDVDTDAAHTPGKQEYNSLLRGIPVLCEGEPHYGDKDTKAEESRHVYGPWHNWADHMLYACECMKEFNEGSDSSSESYEDYKEKSTQVLSLPRRKHCQDQDSPSPTVFHEKVSLREPKMWIQRWSSAARTL
ncbi:hypothetical protein GOP47_0007074 [Adiantum capillus-veneris]|uniref:Uncharacterized protein n=1 Tax=Adiantum capillus-veneris TaxID=13818 RepID=A0A9D4V002_ADICA|nr:hypothetical protein GOP47_0007074 [Adiantum capillus-veneris]